MSKSLVQYLKEKCFQEKKKCPQYGNEMTEVSITFKTSTKKDMKQWEKLSTFYNVHGFFEWINFKILINTKIYRRVL